MQYAGLPCLDPRVLYRQRRKFAVTSHLWAGKANSYKSTVGPDAGRAWILMQFKHAQKIDASKPADLICPDNNGLVTIKNLWFIGATPITPGADLDPQAAYLLELADCRWIAYNPHFSNPIQVAYNVRAPAAPQTYYTDTLNNGNPWTWQAMLDDMWMRIGLANILGQSPQFITDSEPDGTPENFRFHHVSGWLAWCDVLYRVGYAPLVDPNTGTVFIDIIGAADQSLMQAQQAFKARRIYDMQPFEANATKVPAVVRVVFQDMAQHYGVEQTTGWANDKQWSVGDDSHAPFTFVDVPNPNMNMPGVIQGTMAVVYDDLSSVIAIDGTVSNQMALDARAQDRAGDYFRQVFAGDKWFWTQYAGYLSDGMGHVPPGFVPGRGTTGLSYHDYGSGWITEVWNNPGTLQPTLTRTNSAMSFGSKGVGFPGEGGSGGAQILERLQTPAFGRVRFPNYPLTEQVVKVTGPAVALNVYPGLVELANPTVPSSIDQETCYVWAVNSQTMTNGTYYTGRLFGTNTQGGDVRPLYAVTEGNKGGGGAIVVELDDQSVVVNNVNTLELHQPDFLLSSPVNGTALQSTRGWPETPGMGQAIMIRYVSNVTFDPVACNVNVTFSTATLQYKDGLLKTVAQS